MLGPDIYTASKTKTNGGSVCPYDPFGLAVKRVCNPLGAAQDGPRITDYKQPREKKICIVDIAVNLE